jgi:hypothetical protein
MARLGINTGTAPNDGTGDTLFQAGDKTNKNFSELYNFLGNGTDLASGFVTSITAGDNIRDIFAVVPLPAKSFICPAFNWIFVFVLLPVFLLIWST